MSAPINGVSKSLTKAVISDPNAPPMTTATAKSSTLPRSTNWRKPFSMEFLLHTMKNIASRLACSLCLARTSELVVDDEGDHHVDLILRNRTFAHQDLLLLDP